MAYQPRLFSGAFRASSDGRPSHEPPSATPWPMRSTDSQMMAAKPRWEYVGRKAMPAVDTPSRKRANVSLALRPMRRWISMKITVPNGRAMKANEKIRNAYNVPSRRSSNGKKTRGNTSTEAMA
ncbi:hypothetical protein D3C72_982500 [compost metagenome]